MNKFVVATLFSLTLFSSCSYMPSSTMSLADGKIVLTINKNKK